MRGVLHGPGHASLPCPCKAALPAPGQAAHVEELSEWLYAGGC